MNKKILIPLSILFSLFTLPNCENDDQIKPAVSSQLTNVTHITASFKITASNPENLIFVSHGVCWSEQKNPNLSDSYIEVFSNKEQTECTVADLIPETQYYAKAYMVSEAGTSFTEEISFKTNLSGLPTLETKIASEITATSAMIVARIIDDGNTTISENGICYSTEPDPTVDDQKVILSTNSERIKSQLENLTLNALYYVRPYATNMNGTGYGNEINVKTSWGTMKDVEGNIYQTIKIGDQIWMRENLKTAKYADGRGIPDGTGLGYIADRSQKAQFVYDDNPANLEPYGRLYNWAAVIDNEPYCYENPKTVQGVCPDGWHVPSDAEWIEMEKSIGLDSEQLYIFGDRGIHQGWVIHPGGSSGFDALFAGARSGGGFFAGVPNNGCFYSSTETTHGITIFRRTHSGTGSIERSIKYSNRMACSVRCVKD